MNQKEYNTSKVGLGCAYMPLSAYTDSKQTETPEQQLSASRTVVVVPSYGLPGYVKLSYASAPCGGYSSLGNAYKDTCNY